MDSVPVRGRRQVAQELTSGFDTFGLSGVEYQWVRVDDDGAETDIPGADAAAYTLTGDDVGNRIKLRVAFDYQGDDRSGASQATSLINTAPRVLVSNYGLQRGGVNGTDTRLQPRIRYGVGGLWLCAQQRVFQAQNRMEPGV